MDSNDRQLGAWETELKRPCYANAPGCAAGPGHGTQHWCTGERGHSGPHVCSCGQEFQPTRQLPGHVRNRAFQYQYTASGVRYSAPAGMHDDCVCALALAVKLHAEPIRRAIWPSPPTQPIYWHRGLAA
jgi:hypothetical protein